MKEEEEGARGWCGGREVRNNNRKSIVNFDWPNPLDAPSLNVPSFFLLLFFFFESRRAHELYNYSILIVASIHLVAGNHMNNSPFWTIFRSRTTLNNR